MDLIEKMREESSSGHVAFAEFILKLKMNTDVLFCFFEGKDDHKYYSIRIEATLQKKFETISCEGKENLITVKNLISKIRAYRKIATAYFVDQDFEKALEVKNVYCLPSYSIENQYANTATLKKIAKREFSLEEDDPDYATLLDIFLNLQNEFHNKTKFINAWLACQSDKRKIEGLQTGLKIDKTIGKYFSSIIGEDLQSISGFEDLNQIDTIQSLFPDAPIITSDQINEKLNFFDQISAYLTFRGKFQLRFFISFLDRLKSQICKKSPTLFNKNHKCSLRFEYATSLTNLSIYAETPGCLYKYLNSYKIPAA